MAKQSTSPSNRGPWMIAGVLGCLVVCLMITIVGGGIWALRPLEPGATNAALTSVPIPPSPPSGGGVPLPPPKVDHGVTCLIEQEGTIFANAPDLYNYVSDDGGLTWRETPRSTLPHGSYCLGRDQLWQLYATFEGQIRYRITRQLGIERSEDSGKTWKREVDVSGEQWQAKPQTGTPVKVDETPGPFDAMVHRASGNVVVAMGHLGVLVRTPDSKWQWVRVGNYYRGDIGLLPTPPPRTLANPTPLPTLVKAQKLLSAHPQNSTNNSFGIAFSSDSQTLAMVGFDAIHLWRTSDWLQVRTIAQQDRRGVVEGIVLAPDGQTLAFSEGNSNNIVQVWNIKNGTLIRNMTPTTSWVTSLAVSADGNMFAIGTSFKDPGVRLMRIADGALIRTLTGNLSSVTRIAFSPDGQFLAAGGPNQVWHIADGNACFSFEGGARLPTLQGGVVKKGSLIFSPDSKSLFAVEGDQSMRVWNVSDGSLARMIMLPLPHGFDVQSVAFSADGKLLATGLDNGTIWLWRLSDMALLSRFTLGAEYLRVAEVAFSPDGLFLAAASDFDNTVRVWSLSSTSQ